MLTFKNTSSVAINAEWESSVRGNMRAENTSDDFCDLCTPLNIMETNKNLSYLKLRLKFIIIQKENFNFTF